jgi:hypothetical protein
MFDLGIAHVRKGGAWYVDVTLVDGVTWTFRRYARGAWDAPHNKKLGWYRS